MIRLTDMVREILRYGPPSRPGMLRRAAMSAAVLSVGLLILGFRPGTQPGDPLGPAVVAAASPSPSAGTGDTRSVGQGPGIVGSPLAAIGGVLVVAVVAGTGTLLYVRLRPAREPGRVEERTAEPRGAEPRGGEPRGAEPRGAAARRR